jgi:hypothetical protein
MAEPETEPGNATALCRKWLRGRCRHGITCLYRHGSPSLRRTERDEEFGPPPLIPAGTSAEDGTEDSAAPIQAGVGYKARVVATGGSDSSGLHHTEHSYREGGISLGRIIYAAHNAGPDIVPGFRDVTSAYLRGSRVEEENRDLESRVRKLFRQRVRDRWGRYVRQLENVQRIRDVHTATAVYLFAGEQEETQNQEESEEIEELTVPESRLSGIVGKICGTIAQGAAAAARSPRIRADLREILYSYARQFLRTGRYGTLAATVGFLYQNRGALETVISWLW